MLSLFKEKIQNVQDGISSSLKRPIPPMTPCKSNNAGAKLLANYEKNWEEIHNLTEYNARTAQDIDYKIGKHFTVFRSQKEAISKFNQNIADLNNLINLTEKAVNAIGSIRYLVEEVQDKIVECQDAYDQKKLVNKMLDAENSLIRYKQHRLSSLDMLREQLSREYKEKESRYELKENEIKKQNFESADKQFQTEMEIYRQTGTLPPKEPVQQSVNIEEVEVEQNFDNLNEYLQS